MEEPNTRSRVNSCQDGSRGEQHCWTDVLAEKVQKRQFRVMSTGCNDLSLFRKEKMEEAEGEKGV